MKTLFYANRLANVVKIRPLTQTRADATRTRLALELRRPLGDFSDLTLAWRALRVAARSAKSLAELRVRVTEVGLGLFRTAKLLESYAVGELTQLFRVNQLPGAFAMDNPLLTASGLQETYAFKDVSWDSATTAELVNFAAPNSGPAPSSHEVVEIAAYLANLPFTATDPHLAGGWEFTEATVGTLSDMLDGLFATRFLEYLRHRVLTQEVAVEASTASGGSIPERAALLRSVAAELLAIPLSAYKMYGEHMLSWISHPYTSPYLAIAMRERYERAASAFAFAAAAVNVQAGWENLTSLGKRPIAEGAVLDSPLWAPVAAAGFSDPPEPTEDFVPVRAGVGLAFTSDREYRTAVIPPGAHTAWLETLTGLTTEIGSLIARAHGLDLSTAGSQFAPLHDYVPAGEVMNVEKSTNPIVWPATAPGIPVTSSEMYFAMLQDEEGRSIFDPASLVTLGRLKKGHKRAAGTGVLNFVGPTTLDERRKDYDDRLLIPMTANDMLRDAAHTKPSLDGLLFLWGRSKGLWDLEARALNLASPYGPALRQLASALRFVGVLALEFSSPQGNPSEAAPATGRGCVYIYPRQRHWYHGSFAAVQKFLSQDKRDEIVLAEAPNALDDTTLRGASLNDVDFKRFKSATRARLILRPFKYVPDCSATRFAPGNLRVVPVGLMRRDAAAITWIDQTGITTGASIGQHVPEITAWARPREPISDVHLLFRQDGARGPKFDLHGDGVAARWAAKKNGLAQLIGSEEEAIPADLTGDRNFEDPTDDHLSTAWDEPSAAAFGSAIEITVE